VERAMNRPLVLLLGGLALMLLGWFILFFILLGFLSASLTLSFTAYGMSFAGLVLGVVGVVEYRRRGD
jgi:hypothetical protein